MDLLLELISEIAQAIAGALVALFELALQACAGLFDFIMNWRFAVCLLTGIAAAVYAWIHMAGGPPRWSAAGGSVVIGGIIGWFWDRGK